MTVTTTPAPPRDEALRVRPLPATEPGTGDRPHTVVAPADPAPGPAPDQAVPIPARRAAHALVLMALEVVDRHRPPQQTRGAFPPHIVEMLRSLARTGVPGQELGRARIHRIHINPAVPAAAGPSAGAAEAASTDFEVCATYARGPRLFAAAARIRVTPTGATCSALRLA